MFGQDHHWNLEGNYQNSMTLLCSVEVIGTPVTEGYEIAAFCGSSLRSNGTTVSDNGYFLLNIKGNKGDLITFKLYDYDGEKELITDFNLTFKVNAVIGYPTPEVINFVRELHWDYTGNPQVTMSVMSTIKVDGIPITTESYQLAAFVGTELRGVCMPKKNIISGNEVILASLNVAGLYDEEADEAVEETITFKLWDYANEKEYTALNTLVFEEDAQIGQYPEFYEMNFTSFEPVARIGDDVFCPSLANAVSKAQLDELGNIPTITLLKDIEESGLVINKDVIIDFADFDYTFTSPADATTVGLNILKGEGTANDVTLKNGNFIVSATAGLNMLVENYADLTIENVSLNGQNLTDNSYVLSFVSGEVNINNSEIVANSVEGETHYAFRTMNQDGFSAPVVNLWYDLEHYTNTFDPVTEIGEVLYTNTVTGLVEYTGGSILGNTNDILDVVAKKSFEAAPGTGVAGWGTISTPVYTKGQTCILIPAAEEGAHDLYKYDEKTAGWLYYTGENAQHPFNTFDLGQGYLYANTEATTIELQGKLANGKAVGFNISYNPTLPNGEVNPLAGFNFIGNPYSCNIALGQFNLEGSGFTMSTGFYHVTEEGALEVVYGFENDYIKPMESVMIQVEPESSKSVNHRSMLTIHPYSVAERSIENNGYLTINVSNNDYSDVAYVSFNEGLGLDKINHRNSDIPMVSVSVDGADYALATMSQDVTEIPVTFKAAQMGEYTIGVEARDCEYSTMTLVDRLSGIETNLLLEDYTFIAKSGDNSDRFVIRLAKDNGSNNGSENFAYINNGMMFINNIAGQAVINVYDVTGRPVAEYNVAESASISTSDFAAGMYIIRMSDENGVKVQKIIVE